MKPQLNGLNLSGVKQAYLNEYFGVWSMYNDNFESIIGRVQNINIATHVEASADHDILARRGDEAPYEMTRDGVAIINVEGPMMKYSSSFSSNCSTVRVRREISHALENEDVAAVMFYFDTPGGTVSGTQDLAAAIADAASKKPTAAFIEDLCASAGYWCASQCGKVYANQPTALVGSIGTYAVLYDLSAAAEKQGVKVHVVRAGDFKGAGADGTEVTAEQLSDWQRLVDSMNEQFLAGVESGRGVSQTMVKQWADGRVHPAQNALDLGLIDGIKSNGEVIAELVSLSQESSPMKINSQKNGTNVVAEDSATETETETTTADTSDSSGSDKTETETVDGDGEDGDGDNTETKTDDSESTASAQADRYIKAFGEDAGPKLFTDSILNGTSFEDASAKHIAAQNEQIALLEKKLVAADSSELKPVSGNDPNPSKGKGMASKIKIAGKTPATK